MASNKTNKNMLEVPDHMMAQVVQYMTQLDVTEKEHMDTGVTEDEEFEVRRVLNSRFVQETGWEFLILFKDKSTHWIPEKDCFCEQKIAEHLEGEGEGEGKGIRTAYLFCRVSTNPQMGKTSTSLEGQSSELREALKELPQYQRIRVYNISGSAYKSIPDIMKRVGKATRPGDSIWVWRVDRLSRNILKFLGWLEDLSQKGVEIYAKNENLRYSKHKITFMQCILDAQKESAALGERVKLAYKRKRARGDEHIGRLPYGKKYRRILSEDGKSTVRMVVENNPATMAILKEIKESRFKEPPGVTAERLNSQGKFKLGRKWNAAMVRRCQKKL